MHSDTKPRTSQLKLHHNNFNSQLKIYLSFHSIQPPSQWKVFPFFFSFDKVEKTFGIFKIHYRTFKHSRDEKNFVIFQRKCFNVVSKFASSMEMRWDCDFCHKSYFNSFLSLFSWSFLIIWHSWNLMHWSVNVDI